MRSHSLTAAFIACMASVGIQAQQPSRGVALDDVLVSALTRNASVLVARTLSEASDGARVAARRPFDARFSTLMNVNRDRTAVSTVGSPALVAEPNDNLTSSFLIDKAFRSGPSLRSAMRLDRFSSGTDLSASSLNQTSASVDLILPLLKGRGVGQAAAYERSARRDHDGSVLDERHEAAEVALAAALAYWDYVAAYRRLDIYRQSEERSAKLAEETRLLIHAEERAPSDLDLMRANLSSKQVLRLSAERRLVEARRQLGVVMGLAAADIDALAAPETGFPDAGGDDERAGVDALVNEAQGRRDDLAAAKARKEGTHWLALGARNDLQPRFDLDVRVGYAGAALGRGLTDYFAPFGRLPGTTAQVQFVYEPAWGDSAVRGAALQSEAAQTQAAVVADDLSRRIDANARAAAASLSLVRSQLESARGAVRLSTAAVATEQEKFRLGLATLFDAILSEDTLTNSLLAEVDGQLQYAGAIAQVRFETGTLLTGGPGTPTVDAHTLISMAARSVR